MSVSERYNGLTITLQISLFYTAKSGKLGLLCKDGFRFKMQNYCPGISISRIQTLRLCQNKHYYTYRVTQSLTLFLTTQVL